MADDYHGDVFVFRNFEELYGASPDLRYAAGFRFQLVGVDRLDRIDDNQGRSSFGYRRQDPVDQRLSDKADPVRIDFKAVEA